MQPKLTAKEVDFISDLMNLEENVAKKATFYSKTLTDVTLAEEMKAIACNHAKRYVKDEERKYHERKGRVIRHSDGREEPRQTLRHRHDRSFGKGREENG